MAAAGFLPPGRSGDDEKVCTSDCLKQAMGDCPVKSVSLLSSLAFMLFGDGKLNQTPELLVLTPPLPDGPWARSEFGTEVLGHTGNVYDVRIGHCLVSVACLEVYPARSQRSNGGNIHTRVADDQ